jgi:large subunit ribosomal protein L1
MELKHALDELRKNEKRKFEQSIDLIINLKGIDIKRDNVSAVISFPHLIKEKKICGFFTKKNDIVDVISQPEFQLYKDKKALKNLVKKYDFFIAVAPLMPSVATTFGKILGPAGKMPTPQLGIIMQENDKAIKELVEKISKSVRVKMKEASIKICVGREGMKNEDIAANIGAAYNSIVNALPTKRENVKSVLVKLTMSKPVKVEIK